MASVRDAHGPERPRNVRAQAAHLAHVLLAADRVNHRAGRQEQQALEERVRHQVEDAGGECAHAAGHEHVAELRDRGVGEHLLDVGLRDADGRGEEARSAFR